MQASFVPTKSAINVRFVKVQFTDGDVLQAGNVSYQY